MSRVVSLGDVGGFVMSGEWTSALSLAADPCRCCTTIDVSQHQSVVDDSRFETPSRLGQDLSLGYAQAIEDCVLL